MTTSLNAV